MSDYSELKRLAEAFPGDLDWDSNTEPFFNGPSGESLGGGPTGYYCVYGAPFEIDGDQYDGHTYVETCKVDFAKFMVSAREGVLALIAEVEALRKDAELHQQIQRAAKDLPSGWEIRVCVERESGYVELWDQDGCEVDSPNSCESLALTVSDAIDDAMSNGEQP